MSVGPAGVLLAGELGGAVVGLVVRLVGCGAEGLATQPLSFMKM